MSTSPSWFDQEKFTRLVKKVGAKTAPGTSTATSVPSAPKESKRPLRPQETVASRSPATPTPSVVLGPSVKASQPIQRPKTASLPDVTIAKAPVPVPVIVPEPEDVETEETAESPAAAAPLPTPSSSAEETLPGFPVAIAPPEQRSVSPLSRRTTPLPDLKSLFEYEKPASGTGTIPPVRSEPPAADKEQSSVGPRQIDSKTEAPEPVSDMPLSEPEENSSSSSESDRAEIELLRGQIAQLDEVMKERDDARREAALLRAQLTEQDAAPEAHETGGSPEELARALEDRDSARRDYANLREQFETMKQEQVRSRGGEPAQKTADLEAEIESLRTQLAQHEEEFNALKLAPIGDDHEINSLHEEADVLQKQLNQAREEASIAQRGLALSQKALQETRDALREASEGSSQTKTSFDSLKNEYATLAQQNTLLQAQHDQVSREVANLKSKTQPKSQPSI